MTDPTFTIEISGYRKNTIGSGKIEAIKELRQLNPTLGLREAKEIVETSELNPMRFEDATPMQADFARSCTHLACRVVVPAASEDVAQFWREVYVAALTTLLHYTDKPSAEAKRLADQAVADYRSALEQTDENS